MKSVAVIGQGFVGGSLTTVLAERGLDVYVYDKTGKVAAGGNKAVILASDTDPVRPVNSISDLVTSLRHPSRGVAFSGIYFVCLPTPMYEDGSADLSIVEGALKELASMPGDRIAVIKSTVPPGSTERWNKQFEGTGLHVVHCPEFLTEANALDDMRNQDRIILGGPRPWINQVKQVFQSAFPNVPIVKTSSTTSEFVKYMTNVHLASRVVLSCELYQIAEALGKNGMNIDYDKALEYAKFDKRLGGSHMNVPGQEGVLGARGHCFPKDLNALIAVAKEMGVKPTVMEGVWKKNIEVVPEEHRDWEKMVGRAVSKKPMP